MYCNKCGKNNRDAAIFCDYCGAELPDMFDRARKVKGENGDDPKPSQRVLLSDTEKKTSDSNDNAGADTERTPSKSEDSAAATILFGPFGLLYVSPMGGVIMLIVLSVTVFMAVMEVISFPVFLILIGIQWGICLVWRSLVLKRRQSPLPDEKPS